ncbi:hypothetical protein AB834_02860 [PVC group bacterium (ex Bugula neritina AB1)]|nr:hypothetical protein AB834_02860 [PVC group bacterium (ex Bugula neritina AB1)]
MGQSATAILDKAKKITIQEAFHKFNHLENCTKKGLFFYFDCPFCGKKTKIKELRSGGYARSNATSLGCNSCIGGNVLNSVLIHKFGRSDTLPKGDLIEVAKGMIGYIDISNNISPSPKKTPPKETQNIDQSKTLDREFIQEKLEEKLVKLEAKRLCDSDQNYIREVCKVRGLKYDLLKGFDDSFVLCSKNKFLFLAYDQDTYLHGFQFSDLSVKGGRKMNTKYSDFSKIVFWMPPFLHEGRKDALIIVESPHDAFYLNLLGFPSIALFGSSFGIKKQEFTRSIFKKYQFKKIIALPDDDNAGIKFKNSVSKSIFKDIDVVYYNFGKITKGECNDIGDGFQKDHDKTVDILNDIANRD